MLSWTLGTWPSANWLVAREFFGENVPSVEDALTRAATQRYGQSGVDGARKAWAIFSRAFAEYPYSNSLVYSSVVQQGPAHPLWLEPSGQRPKILNSFDDLGWTQPYGPEAVSQAFRGMAAAWSAGVRAFEPVARHGGPRAQADQRIHQAGQLYFESIANQVEIHNIRAKAGALARLRTLIEDELRIAEQFLPICEADPGWASKRRCSISTCPRTYERRSCGAGPSSSLRHCLRPACGSGSPAQRCFPPGHRLYRCHHGQIKRGAGKQDPGCNSECDQERPRGIDDPACDQRRDHAAQVANGVLDGGPFAGRLGSGESLRGGPDIGGEQAKAETGERDQRNADGGVVDQGCRQQRPLRKATGHLRCKAGAHGRLPPARIQESELQPPNSAAMAMPQNGMEPRKDMSDVERPRSRTR